VNFTSNDFVNFTDKYLTHYWPITNSKTYDLIGDADMLSGLYLTNPILYSTDRFGNQNEALNLNNGYTFLSPDYYFSTPAFSISLWINPLIDQSYPINSAVNLINFGNGNDNIILNLLAPNMSTFQFFYSTTCVINVQSFISLANSQWNLLTATYDGLTASIYINGSLAGSVKQAYSMPVITRANNYFGNNNNLNFRQSSLYLDDIRFYNISLTQSQIVNIMNFVPAPNTTCKYSI